MSPNATSFQNDFPAATLSALDEADRWLPTVEGSPVTKLKSNNVLQKFIEQITDLALLPANWDSYGAKTIAYDSVLYSTHLFCQVMFENTPMPQVVPTKSGDIQLEWHTYGIDLEVEICSNRTVHCYLTDAKHKFEDTDWSDNLYRAVENLKPYTEELTSRFNSSKNIAA